MERESLDVVVGIVIVEVISTMGGKKTKTEATPNLDKGRNATKLKSGW